MSSCMVYHFAAFVVVLTHNVIFPVKGQCTVQGCENGDTPNSIVAEIGLQQLFVEAIRQQQNEQVQRFHDLLNASLQQMKSQQETVMTSLQAIDRRSQEQGICIKQVQSINEYINASHQQMMTVLGSLEAFDRRLQEHISTKNKTQNSSKLAIAVGIDLEEGPVLPPIVNNWTVIMHRFDGSLDFNRNWTEYKNGFGDIRRGEFWLGNEKIHRMTNRFNYTLRIEVQLSTSGRWYYADYANFSLDSENNKYAIHLSGFSGNAGDSLTNISIVASWGTHDGQSFTTMDNDNDGLSGVNCAQRYPAGWWFGGCWASCLTCQYGNNFKWFHTTGWQTSGLLRAARMMIKSK